MIEKHDVDERMTLRRLRVFMLAIAAVMLLGAIAELILSGHFDSPSQVAAFGVCALGLASVATVWASPNGTSVRFLRMAMALVTVGSLVGIGFHFSGNLEFARETQPTVDTAELLLKAITGRDPLLAPGMLAVAAALAIAATCSVPKGSRHS